MQAQWLPDQLKPGKDGLTVLGQLGQSLDGQIATATEQSKYINGQGGLMHLHRLRAWADVVVVGVATVVADNPKLTVRLTQGQDPARVVIDPRARAPVDAICLQDTSVRRVILTGLDSQTPSWPIGVEQVALAPKPSMVPNARLEPAQIRAWLAEQGWRRVLVEGGANTLAAFVSAGCLDQLHFITSPLLLGPGVAGVRARPVSDLSLAPRFRVQPYALGEDLLMACTFV